MKRGHYALILEADYFKKDSFNEYEIQEGITICEGILESDNTKAVHSYIFDKNKFTAGESKKWIRSEKLKYKSFMEEK